MSVYVPVTIRVFKGQEPSETQKEEFHLIGDVNRDGVIDTLDNILVMNAFGSTPSSPDWNPDCDLNQDLAINIEDLSLVGSHFGRTIGSLGGLNEEEVSLMVTLDSLNIAAPGTINLTPGTYTITATFAGKTQTKDLTIVGDEVGGLAVLFYFGITTTPPSEVTIIFDRAIIQRIYQFASQRGFQRLMDFLEANFSWKEVST